MNIKKTAAALLVAGASVGLLAACSGGNSSTPSMGGSPVASSIPSASAEAPSGAASSAPETTATPTSSPPSTPLAEPASKASAEVYAKSVIGMELGEALGETSAATAGIEVRVVKIDDEDYPATADYRENRVNLSLESRDDGKKYVVAATIG